MLLLLLFLSLQWPGGPCNSFNTATHESADDVDHDGDSAGALRE